MLVHGVMHRRKWVPLCCLGSWGRAQSLVQPPCVLTEPFWISPSLQDSDGDKSDYNLVVDEVSPWSPAGYPAQAAVSRFRALLPKLWGSLGSSSLLLGSSVQPGHVPALLQCLVLAKTDSTPPAVGRLCQPGLSSASHRLGFASPSPFSSSAGASHMGRLINWDGSSVELGLLLAAPVAGGGRSLTPCPASPRPPAHVLLCLALEQPRPYHTSVQGIR